MWRVIWRSSGVRGRKHQAIVRGDRRALGMGAVFKLGLWPLVFVVCERVFVWVRIVDTARVRIVDTGMLSCDGLDTTEDTASCM